MRGRCSAHGRCNVRWVQRLRTFSGGPGSQKQCSLEAKVMGNRRLFTGLVGAVALTGLVVACDSQVAPSGKVAPVDPGTDGISLGNSVEAKNVVSRALDFQVKALAFTRDRARLVASPVTRQVLPPATGLDMRIADG